jgi:hypothetical protein
MVGPSNPDAGGPSPAPRPSPGRFVVLVVVAVVVVAALGVAVVFLLSTPPPPGEATLDRVDVTAADTQLDERDAVTVSARAIDTAGVDQTPNATLAWSATPAGRVAIGGSGSQVTITALDAGTAVVRATATWNGVTREANATLTIAALSYELTPSDSSPFTGNPISLRVQVLRTDSTVATGYAGTITFTSDDPLADLPADFTFAPADQGDRTFGGVVLREAGAVRITVRDLLATISRDVSLNVQRPLGGPTASFDAARTLMHVDVNATGSTDPDNDIASYAWDWGDGNVDDPGTATASHDYATPGRYTIVLTVTDSASNVDVTARRVSVATSTLDYEYWDFFDVPYADFWDIRQLLYSELPINAECFNATSVAEGICDPTDPNVTDVMTYPYTHFYSGTSPTLPDFVPFIYAPYRMRVEGDDIAGYNRSEPVFLPVFNYSAAPGNLLEFSWYMQYMNQTHAREVETVCGTNLVFGNDGYILDNRITLRMDLQESRRIFGVQGSTPAQAAAWWANTTDPSCLRRNATETAVQNWFISMGGSINKAGKYDIENGYEWYYQVFATNVNWTVNLTTGETTVDVIHLAYGTEVLLGRWFYWGNVSYLDNYLDSTKRAGWWDMETSWFEDFTFGGSLGSSSLDFDIVTVAQYLFSLICAPGPNGLYDRTDDVPIWQWAPYLIDYVNDFSPSHLRSELDRYPGLTLLKCTPGAPNSAYGQQSEFDVTPIAWDLKPGETWRFEFPTGDVKFYDPNLTPPGTHPKSGDYVEVLAPLVLDSTSPASLGDWDATSMVLEVFGPVSMGGASGSPGPDGVPGTADDDYALESLPLINFAPGGGAGAPPAPSVLAAEPAAATMRISPASPWVPLAALDRMSTRGASGRFDPETRTRGPERT